MNQEELFKQIMDAMCKKRCVSPADICGLIELGIPAGTSDEAQGDVNKLYARLKVEQMYNV